MALFSNGGDLLAETSCSLHLGIFVGSKRKSKDKGRSMSYSFWPHLADKLSYFVSSPREQSIMGRACGGLRLGHSSLLRAVLFSIVCFLTSLASTTYCQ